MNQETAKSANPMHDIVTTRKPCWNTKGVYPFRFRDRQEIYAFVSHDLHQMLREMRAKKEQRNQEINKELSDLNAKILELDAQIREVDAANSE